ncbi:MAG: hypothetical protein LAO05_17130 [Acidobacteriia bacterium]|nr:hypothetical protein [Terriglobia bacterium]
MPEELRGDRMVLVIRWTARALGALVLLVFLAILVGQGPPKLSALTTREAIGLLAGGIGLAGLIAAWWWEGIGGALALAGFLLRSIVTRKVFSPWVLWVFPVTGALFLLLWWIRRKGADTGPKALARRHPLTGRLAGRLALSVAALVVALLAAEAALPRPLMTSRAATIPAVAGRWEGRAKVVNEWGPPGEVGFVLVVNGDGTADGTVGAAAFRNAQLVPNRSWLGSVFHIRSDYRLQGRLSGEITPRYAIQCTAFTLPISFGAGTLDGRLTAPDCTRAGKKQGTLRTALIKFRQPSQRKR